MHESRQKDQHYIGGENVISTFSPIRYVSLPNRDLLDRINGCSLMKFNTTDDFPTVLGKSLSFREQYGSKSLYSAKTFYSLFVSPKFVKMQFS